MTAAWYKAEAEPKEPTEKADAEAPEPTAPAEG